MLPSTQVYGPESKNLELQTGRPATRTWRFLGLGVWRLGFGVQGLGFRVWGLGFSWGSGFTWRVGGLCRWGNKKTCDAVPY